MKNFFLPSFSGWMLDYPVIYCHSTFEVTQNSKNNLSMIPLHLYELSIISGNYIINSFAKFGFSVPADLNNFDTDSFIQNFFMNLMKKTISVPELFVIEKITKKDVILTHVIL
jgi:hypothetical protein